MLWLLLLSCIKAQAGFPFGASQTEWPDIKTDLPLNPNSLHPAILAPSVVSFQTNQASKRVQIKIRTPEGSCSHTNIKIRVVSSTEIYFFDVPPNPFTSSKWIDVCLFTNLSSAENLFEFEMDFEHGFHELSLEVRDKTTDVILFPVKRNWFCVGPEIGFNELKMNLLNQIARKQANLEKEAREFQVVVDSIINQYKGHQKISSLYQPINPIDIFDPILLEALRLGTPQAINSLFKKESIHSSLYSFQLFNPKFCAELITEVEHFKSVVPNHTRPNSMNNYGAMISEMGLYPLFQTMTNDVFQKLAAVMFPHWESDSLDSHHGFVVEYELNKDRSLDYHMDQSTLTINVCLGTDFEGGNVFFRGIRGHHSEHSESVEVSHSIGRALFHVGQHWHGANPITQGKRMNLILWLRSSKFTQSSTERYFSATNELSHFLANSF